MGNRYLLIGGGGHCRSVLDSLFAVRPDAVVGIVERDADASGIRSVPVVGTDEDLPRLFDEGWRQAVVTLGSIGRPERRMRLMRMVRELGMDLPDVIDPSAVLGADVTIGKGVFIGKRAVVNTGSVVGDGAIVNTGAVVDHDCRIGDFAHVCSSVLCGEVTVGPGAHVGAGSVVRQRIVIGARALIGVGSVVVSDIPEDCLAYGNPCRIVRTS